MKIYEQMMDAVIRSKHSNAEIIDRSGVPHTTFYEALKPETNTGVKTVQAILDACKALEKENEK